MEYRAKSPYINNRRIHIHLRMSSRMQTNRVRTAPYRSNDGKFGHITVTIIEQLFSIFHLAIPFTVKSLSDFIKRVLLAVIFVKGIAHLSVLFAHIPVLGNLVESIFIKETFGIPLVREILIILVHKFRIFFIDVQQIAELNEIIVIEE